MFDFNDKRRLSPVLHPVPAGVSSVCIFGADGKPLTSKEDNDYEAFTLRGNGDGRIPRSYSSFS